MDMDMDMDMVMDMDMGLVMAMVDMDTMDTMVRDPLLLSLLLLPSQVMDMAMDTLAMAMEDMDTMAIMARDPLMLSLDMAMVDMDMVMVMDMVTVMVMDMDTMVKRTPESCLRVQSEFNRSLSHMDLVI